MQLRDHPLMSYQGESMWPPIWVGGGKRGTRPQGEVGHLREVRYYRTKPGRLFLTMEHEGVRYTGCLLLDDTDSCLRVCELLKKNYGMFINTIGSLEMPVEFSSSAAFS